MWKTLDNQGYFELTSDVLIINSMTLKFLLTSFQTWLPHQLSNSSDDLLSQLQSQNFSDFDLYFLRQLPVDTMKAFELVITEVEAIKPNIIICCGMAEKRNCLTVESNACYGNEQIYSDINLTKLISNLSFTQISDDAGKFVCEALYYQLLQKIKTNWQQTQAIFIHIPILTKTNNSLIIKDFQNIIKILAEINY